MSLTSGFMYPTWKWRTTRTHLLHRRWVNMHQIMCGLHGSLGTHIAYNVCACKGDKDRFYSKKCFFLMCKMKGWWLVLFREVVALNFDSLCTTGEDGNWDVKFPQKWLIHSSTILHTYFIVFLILFMINLIQNLKFTKWFTLPHNQM